MEVQRAKSAAATEYKHVVTQSLVTTLAQTYIDLIEHDSELEISQRALASFQESLRIMRIKEEYGVATPVDVKQAEQLVQTASHSIPLVEQQIVQNEDAINYLLGRNPGTTIRRGDSLQNLKLSATVPAGLPAALLNRRPDIRLAEQLLIAASAHVDVARSSLFPNIVLTASGGSISSALSLLLAPGAGFWALGASLTQPIFDSGELRARYRLTQLQKDELVMMYAQTVQDGFREVADSLANVDHARQALLEQEALTKTAAEQAELSNIRYWNGLTTFLETLDSERTHFASQQALAQARREQLLAVIALYKALGGGWEQ
jgi:multidrug efflux system outer membrane protein